MVCPRYNSCLHNNLSFSILKPQPSAHCAPPTHLVTFFIVPHGLSTHAGAATITSEPNVFNMEAAGLVSRGGGGVVEGEGGIKLLPGFY